MQLCFDFYMIEAKPDNLIGDCAYDSDPLDEELRLVACCHTARLHLPRVVIEQTLRYWLVAIG